MEINTGLLFKVVAAGILILFVAVTAMILLAKYAMWLVGVLS